MADSNLGTQVGFEINSIKTNIAEAICRKLREMRQLVYVEFEDVKIAVSDFQDHDLPAVQIWDLIESVTHEQGRALKSWNLAIELIMKSSDERTIKQKNLWNLMYLIERKLWKDPQLGVKGVDQLIYVSNETDLHLVLPYYTARMYVNVQYRQPLVSEC